MSVTVPPPQSPVAAAEKAVLLGALAVGLFGAFFYWWSRGSLWEDEVIALTHGLQPLPSFFVQVVRNDIHPFVYFLFLKAWSAVAPDSDRWVLASSLVAALASAVSIAWVASRLGGARAAWWAAALFCVLPNFAWAAGNLRMYGLTPGLSVLFWYWSRRYLIDGGRKALAIGITLQLLLAYTHAIQFYFITFIALALLVDAAPVVTRRRLLAWLAAQAVVLIAVLPLAASALLRGTEPLQASNLQSLLLAPAQLFTGWGLADRPLPLAAGTALFVGLFALALRERTARVLAGVVVVGTVATAMLIGFLGKPMFKPPVFTASLVPFLVLAASLGIAGASRRSITVGAAMALLVATALVTVPWSQRLFSTENYGPAGRFIAASVRAGDVVVVPRSSVYWGVMRYAVGAHWGHPLAVMPPSNPQWQALKNRLGSTWSSRLGLDPASDEVVENGVRYVHNVAVAGALAPAARVWVVHRHRYADELRFEQPLVLREVRWFGDELAVSRLESADGAGSDRYANPQRPQ